MRASIKDLKYTQYEECLAWAAENKLSYRKAMSQKGERWPEVERSGLQRRMAGKVKNGAERESQAVLTASEHEDLAWSLKRIKDYGSPADKDDRDEMVCDILE